MNISQETARMIWVAYDEIANGEKLLTEMEKRQKEHENPNPRDAFGKRRNLQLGIPCGETGHTLYDVQPKLAMAVIAAHVADKRAMLTVLCERAKSELATPPEFKQPA